MGVLLGQLLVWGGGGGLVLDKVGSVRVWFAWQRGLIGQVTYRVRLGSG